MITFDLACEHEHRFEGWFRNLEDFEAQMERGLVACPLCGSSKVSKLLSAVAVHVSRRAVSPPPAPPAPPTTAAAVPKTAGPQAVPFFRALAEVVEKHFEDVGPAFASEARKMEEGEVEARNIRGTTTPEEEEGLREDGIEFLKIPVPKYDA